MSGNAADTLQARRKPLSGDQFAGAAPLWMTTTLALAAIGIALILLYWNEVVGAVKVWSDSRAYNHGFLIIPIVAYLIWERREALSGSTPRPALWVMPLVPVVGALWLVTRLVGVLEAQQMLLIALVQLVLLALLGRRVYGALAFPFLYLFFLVPTGEFLVPYLQDFTARFVVAGLHLSGIPVYSDGFLISIPSQNFYVAEACAGLRFLIATIAFGFLFADLTYRSLARKAIFIALCVVAPIFANGIRAYGIIIIAYLTDGRVAAGVDHILYGWIFFSLVTVALMALGWMFRDAQPARGDTPPRQNVAPGTRRRVVVAAALLLCLVAMPRGYAAWLERSGGEHAETKVILPTATSPWFAEPSRGSWHPSFPNADYSAQLGFVNGTARVDLFVAYYATQNQDKKLISSANKLADDDWDISNRSSAVLTVAGERIRVAVTEFSRLGRKRVVVSTYWVDNDFETGAMLTKVRQAEAAITGRGRDVAVIALSTDVADNLGTAVGTIADLAAHLRWLRPRLQTPAGG